MYLAANISNPLIAPFLFAIETEIGGKIRRGHFYGVSTLEAIRFKGFAIDILLGSVVVGLTLGVLGALLTYWAVRQRGDDRKVAAVVDAAAERYLAAGISAWEFARGKLRMDPVYLQILRDGLLPSKGLLLDLGCGSGLLLSLVATARERAGRSEWPDSWPPPPAALQLRGIELRPRAARQAREALEGVADIEEQDLTSATLPSCEVIVLFDVLHLLPPEAQAELLSLIANRLAPRGLLIVREANASGGWRFAMVRLGNRIMAMLHGRGARRFAFNSAGGWHEQLEAAGFSVDSMHPQTSGVFANVLIYARRQPAVSRVMARQAMP